MAQCCEFKDVDIAIFSTFLIGISDLGWNVDVFKFTTMLHLVKVCLRFKFMCFEYQLRGINVHIFPQNWHSTLCSFAYFRDLSKYHSSWIGLRNIQKNKRGNNLTTLCYVNWRTVPLCVDYNVTNIHVFISVPIGIQTVEFSNYFSGWFNVANLCTSTFQLNLEFLMTVIGDFHIALACPRI